LNPHLLPFQVDLALPRWIFCMPPTALRFVPEQTFSLSEQK
jgi:hypothetical protein